MYSNNQWSFNPAAYQNIPYEQVDWASLAQQWIKMKETVPNTNQGPPPPPAPTISKSAEPTPAASTPTAPVTQSNNDIEGGEAPMDMDTKDDDSAAPVGVASSGNWNQWGNWQSQWGWGWSGNAGTVPSADSQTAASVDSKVKSQSNDSIPALNDVRNFPILSNTGTCTPQVPSSFNYNNTGGGMIPPILPKSTFAYENSFVPAKSSEAWNKGNKASNRQPPQKSVPPEQFAVIDAAKKKQLPAWIREGLTKMEREKQKKLERERMVQEKFIMEQMQAEIKEEPGPLPVPAYVQVHTNVWGVSEVTCQTLPTYRTRLEEQKKSCTYKIPPLPEPPVELEPPRRSPPEVKYQQKRRSPVEPTRQRVRTDATALRKTKDQIMEESMLKVRRILTEILLEATEKQVQLIAKEEHRRFRASASAQPIRKSNALTSLTGNLGLDVYDSDDNSSDADRDKDDDVDSDEELKMVIEKKKRDFTLVEDEIERLIDDQEAKERLIAQQDAKDEDDNDDDANEDDEEDEPRIRSNREKDPSGSHQRYSEHDKERQSGDRGHDLKSEDREGYHRSRRRSNSEVKQINGDSKPVDESEKSRSHKKSKSTSRSSSSSSSASASSSSSADSSSESSSTKSDRSGSSSESKKKHKKRKSHKKSDKKSKAESKTKRRASSESDSEKRSSSRSRYYDKYKRGRNSDSAERKRRRRSPSYRRRSPSYHRSSRREQASKYKESPSHSKRREYSPESKRSRYRSSSRESYKHSRYKRR